ncbi:MAG TPA: efflux RND transporter periplasmic adaptor subunit [Candidatus Didemnitutus sp.]|nr:efflux RND transporter periplasmic adaptor subunit [Candidatus Didemnitutus sp.]
MPPNKKILLIAIAALLGGIAFWLWRGRDGHKASFRTAAVSRGDVVATISATGTIEPEEVVDVGAQVAGLISSFGTDRNGKPIDYGSSVEEGTVLAKIDDSVYAADLALARAQVEQDQAGEMSAAANLAQLRAKAEQAEADWKRAEELGPSEALARTLYDSYKANRDIAVANVSVGKAAVAEARAATVQARATLDKAQRNVAFCTIKSPVRGVIIDRRVNAGQTVVASLNAPSLFLIAKDLTKMQIWAGVNEADVGRIVPGSPVIFTCDTFPGREFTGAVGKVRLNATMTQNVVMYTVEVNTENPKKLLLPYLTASVRFVVRKDVQALVVPNAALRWLPSALSEVAPEARSWKLRDATSGGSRDPGGTVWIQEGNFARPIEVEVGASDGMNTAVSAGDLREGQEVITSEDARAVPGSAPNPFLPPPQRR